MATSNHSSTTTDTVPARSFKRAQHLLIAIERIEKPSLQSLIDRTGIPERSIHALLARLSREYWVAIERVDGRRYGYYRIADWGALNRDRILASVESQISTELDEEEQINIDFHQI